MIFRVIDFETTGEPSPERPAGIVELGFWDVELIDGASHIRGSCQKFVNPGIPVEMEARAVHHITDEQIAKGISPAEAEAVLLAPSMNGEAPRYFVAHNAAFEEQFFTPFKPWLCTYKIALRKFPDAPKHSNQFLRYYLGLNLEPELAAPPHRALPDAYVTAHILMHLLDFNPPLDVLERISASPPQPDKISFGKHKGQRWRDLPRDYLDWIVTKSDMDNDVKWLAGKWLEAETSKGEA